MISTAASRNLKSPVKMASSANASHSATLSKKSAQHEMVASAKGGGDDRFRLDDRSERSSVSTSTYLHTLYCFYKLFSDFVLNFFCKLIHHAPFCNNLGLIHFDVWMLTAHPVFRSMFLI